MMDGRWIKRSLLSSNILKISSYLYNWWWSFLSSLLLWWLSFYIRSRLRDHNLPSYHHYCVVISFNNPSFQLELLFSIFPFQVREGEGVVLVCEVTFNIAFCFRTNILRCESSTLILIRSWVALSFKVCVWISQSVCKVSVTPVQISTFFSL